MAKLHASCEQSDNMVIEGYANDGRTYIGRFPNIKSFKKSTKAMLTTVRNKNTINTQSNN